MTEGRRYGSYMIVFPFSQWFIGVCSDSSNSILVPFKPGIANTISFWNSNSNFEKWVVSKWIFSSISLLKRQYPVWKNVENAGSKLTADGLWIACDFWVKLKKKKYNF